MFVRSIITAAALALVAVASSRDATASAPLRFEGCVQQIGVFPIDSSRVTLPAGFRPVAFQDSSPAGESAVPGPPGATATVQLTATSCAASSGPRGRSGPVTVVQAWLYAEPPPHLQADGIDAYLVVPWIMASDPGIAKSLTGLGLPATQGALTNIIERTDELVSRGTVEAGGGDRVVRLDVLVPSVVRDTRPERLRLFGVHGRRVTGTVDFVEDEHTHVLIGSARLGATGKPPFPMPPGPGIALHVERGYGVRWVPIR